MLRPFHGFLPPPPCAPRPQHLVYSYELLPALPPPATQPFPFIHSSRPLLICLARVPFVSTYVSPSAAPTPPHLSPTFKHLSLVQESGAAAAVAVAGQEIKPTVGNSSRHPPFASPICTTSNSAAAGPQCPPRPWLQRGATRGRKKQHFVWVPRSSTGDDNSRDDVIKNRRGGGSSDARYMPSSRSLEIDPSDPGTDRRTSVMIKNIPNKFSRDMLIALLDEHCAKENETASSPASAYDFVYLPIDFTSGCNLGYAFVNFTTAVAVKRLHASFHRRRWSISGSRKVAHVCYARFQGKRAFVSHFSRSCFRCDTDEFLPVTFDPPRNGSTFRPSPITIGRRLGSSPLLPVN